MVKVAVKLTTANFQLTTDFRAKVQKELIGCTCFLCFLLRQQNNNMPHTIISLVTCVLQPKFIKQLARQFANNRSKKYDYQNTNHRNNQSSNGKSFGLPKHTNCRKH